MNGKDNTPTQSSELVYRQMFEHNLAIKLLVDPADGSIVDANVAACDFYGYGFDEMRKLKIWDISTTEREALIEGMTAAKKPEGRYAISRHRLVDGTLRDVEEYSGPLTVGGRTLLYSIVHDITERRRTEVRLRESERYFRSLIENAADIITITDLEGTILYESPSLKRVLGYESWELIGQPMFQYFHDDEIPAVLEDFARVAKTPGSMTTREVRVRARDGTWRYLEATACNLLNDPAVRGIVINSRDVTERKHAEEQLRQRTVELEKLNAFMVDRELRMVELKREIARLKKLREPIG